MIYLFDIDGTLIAAHGAGRRAFERALLHVHGLERGLDGIQLDGKTDPLILDEAFLAAGRSAPTDEDRRRLFAEYVDLLEAELERGSYAVLPGVGPVLAHLEARGAILGLQTGNLELGARRKLERGGLWQRFAFGGFGSDAHRREDLVAIAIARGQARAPAPVAPEAVWVIGDTPRDIQAARASGARAVGVATGSYDVAALTAAGADVVVESLVEWLDRGCD